MLILRGSTISTFDIVKVKKHMAFNQCGKISDSQNQILFGLPSDHVSRELGAQKRLKRSNYNYFVKKKQYWFSLEYCIGRLCTSERNRSRVVRQN